MMCSSLIYQCNEKQLASKGPVMKVGVDTLLSFSFVKEIGQLKHQSCLNISFVICIKLLVMNIHQNIRAKIKTKMLMFVTIEIFINIFFSFHAPKLSCIIVCVSFNILIVVFCFYQFCTYLRCGMNINYNFQIVNKIDLTSNFNGRRVQLLNTMSTHFSRHIKRINYASLSSTL